MGPVVDAHHHFWRLSEQEQPWRTQAHEGIAADYGPGELAEELARSGVDATVLIESVDTAAENDRLREYARATPFVAGVVGWLPLADPARARAELSRIRDSSLRGVRCLVGSAPLDRLEEADAIALFRALADEGLAWDIVPVTAAQAQSVVRIARAVPSLRVVVDHLARPPVDGGGWRPWSDHVRRLADCPNVALKVSVGLDVLGSWPAWRGRELRPYVDWAARCFGPRRLMLASNWPVVLLRSDYGQAWADLVESVRLAGIDGNELNEVLGGTATRWYGLSLDVTRPGSAEAGAAGR